MAAGRLVASLVLVALLCVGSEGKAEPFRRDPGHPQWHHGAFQDVKQNVEKEARNLLHTRAEVPFHVPLEINVVLVGFNRDGGYRYSLKPDKLEDLLRKNKPSHRPACLETGELLDIEHDLVYNVISVGQPEMIAVEYEVRKEMREAGTAREQEFGRELSLFEVEARRVEPLLDTLYQYLFEEDPNSDVSVNSAVPYAIFVLNLDKVRMNPKVEVNVSLEEAVGARIFELSEQELREQEAGYVYKYRYNGGSSTQVWLAAGRYVVIDLAAGPCTYGRVDSEEGSVGYRTVPRLRNLMFPRGRPPVKSAESEDTLGGQIAALVATAIEQVISPDVRFETLDATSRLLVPVIILQNHHSRKSVDAASNFGINVAHIEHQVTRFLQPGQEAVVVAGVHSLHDHPRLAIAVSKAIRGESIHEIGRDGRVRASTRTYLDGAILRDEMLHSADVLAAGLLEISNPGLSIQYFWPQTAQPNRPEGEDSVIRNRVPSYGTTPGSKAKKEVRRPSGESSVVKRAYGTRVVPVFVLSLAGVDEGLLMDGESLWWASHDCVIVLQHGSELVPLSYVSETKRREAYPRYSDRHIVAGLASVVGGLVAPYERASHVHDRPVVNWLWASGHHPFGPFSNTSTVSRLLLDTALRNAIYSRVDMALRGVRKATENVQTFVNEYFRTPIGEPVKGKSKKMSALWLDKFYKHTTNLPEPVPHEVVEKIESYLDSLEKQLVDLSALLYDHHLKDAHRNSSHILQMVLHTQAYVERVVAGERDKMRCCSVEYNAPVQHSQALLYGGILLAGFLIYFLVICLSSPER